MGSIILFPLLQLFLEIQEMALEETQKRNEMCICVDGTSHKLSGCNTDVVPHSGSHNIFCSMPIGSSGYSLSLLL